MEDLEFVLWAGVMGAIPIILIIAWCHAVLNKTRPAIPWHKQPLPKDGGGTGAVAPLPVESLAEQKRQAWREWVEKDGSQAGLEAFLEEWRDVAIEKPKLIAGMDVASKRKDVTVLEFVETKNGIATHHRVEFEDIVGPKITAEKIAALAKQYLPQPLLSGIAAYGAHPGNDAAVRTFFERNWDRMRGSTLSAEEAKQIAFELKEGFKAGQWVRGRRTSALYADDLMKVLKVDAYFEWLLVEGSAGQQMGVKPDEIEPALPRPGEWWRKTKTCALGLEIKPFHPHQIPSTGPCGRCLYEPVNFGRGEEAKG